MTAPEAPPDTPYQREQGYAERYRDRRFSTGSGRGTHRRESAAIRRLLRGLPERDGRWLDMPSGTGRMSDLLPGAVVRADRAAEMLLAAPAGGPRICASATALPFADDLFVGALCHRLLHHIPQAAERVRILSELRRVTDGPVLLSFFHSFSLQHGRRLLSRQFGKRRSGRCAITLAQIGRDLEAAGLRVTARAPLMPFVSEQWLLRTERI